MLTKKWLKFAWPDKQNTTRVTTTLTKTLLWPSCLQLTFVDYEVWQAEQLPNLEVTRPQQGDLPAVRSQADAARSQMASAATEDRSYVEEEVPGRRGREAEKVVESNLNLYKNAYVCST